MAWIMKQPFYKRFLYWLNIYATNAVYVWQSKPLGFSIKKLQEGAKTQYKDFKVAYETYCSMHGYEVVDLLSPEIQERFEIEFGVRLQEVEKVKGTKHGGPAREYADIVLRENPDPPVDERPAEKDNEEKKAGEEKKKEQSKKANKAEEAKADENALTTIAAKNAKECLKTKSIVSRTW